MLFLELNEDEADPKTFSIPTFIALPSCVVESMLKTLKKGRRLVKQLVRPHTHTEIRMMSRMMYHVDSKALCNRFKLGSDATWEAVLAIVNKRLQLTGPLAREIFKPQGQFDNYIGKMPAKATLFATAAEIVQL